MKTPTILIHIIFTSRSHRGHERQDIILISFVSHYAAYLSHNDNFSSRNLVFAQGEAEKFFGAAI